MGCGGELFDGAGESRPLGPVPESGEYSNRGLPIGNLTSQFWSNCYMNPLDPFIKRELGCAAYLRYVDDMALFSDSKNQLWEWKLQLIHRLEKMRLTIHAASA